MRNTWTLLFVLMQIAGFGGAATAQTDDQQRCSAPDPDLSISGCTAMIQSGHETQQDLAKDFSNRGTAYGRKGQLDRAIEDFDLAIRLVWGFLCQGYHAIFVVLCHSILLFDPRREHSSVPTAYFHRRRAQRRSRTALLQRRRRLVLDGREHGGRLPAIGWLAA